MSCPISLVSPSIRAAAIQHCQLLCSVLLTCKRNWGRAGLSPSIAIKMRSLRQPKFQVQLNKELLRQGEACWGFQNFSCAKRKEFYHCRLLMDLLEKTCPTNSPLCGSFPPTNILLKMKLTFLLTSLKFPSQSDRQIMLILILILKSIQKRGNFLISNGIKTLFSISKWKV